MTFRRGCRYILALSCKRHAKVTLLKLFSQHFLYEFPRPRESETLVRTDVIRLTLLLLDSSIVKNSELIRLYDANKVTNLLSTLEALYHSQTSVAQRCLCYDRLLKASF